MLCLPLSRFPCREDRSSPPRRSWSPSAGSIRRTERPPRPTDASCGVSARRVRTGTRSTRWPHARYTASLRRPRTLPERSPGDTVRSPSMLKSFLLTASSVMLAVVAAHGQGARPLAAPPAEADMQKLQTAMLTAQTASIRPGDEALGCDALQKELTSAMSDPSIQTYAAKTNPTVARDLATREKAKGSLTPEAAAAISAALAPAMMMPAQMNQLVTIMPVLMRSQRVSQLAAVKSCAW